MVQIINKSALKRIKKRLKRGDRKTIAKNSGTSQSAVSQALNGKIQSLKIIEESIRIIALNDNIRKNFSEKIKTI